MQPSQYLPPLKTMVKAKPIKKVKRKPKFREKPGRPEYVPTEADRNLVRRLAELKIPQDEIALMLINPQTGRSIAETTLKNIFADEIAFGYANSRVRHHAALMRNALGEVSVTKDENGNVTETVVKEGNVAAQIFCGKTMFGLREVDSAHGTPDPLQDDPAADEAVITIAQARDVAFALALGKKLLQNKKP